MSLSSGSLTCVRARPLHVIIACLVVLLACTVTSARAAETVSGGYAASALRYMNGQAVACSGWSGSTDGAGFAYIGCGAYIHRIDAAGTVVESIATPVGFSARRDVAVNATGTTLYYIVSDQIVDIPPAGSNVGKVVRMLRAANGTWVHDTSFTLGPFPIGASNWSPRGLALDGTGRLFMTVNAFVYVFNNKGEQLFRFGGDDKYNGATYLEGLEVGQGLAVPQTGTSVYVVEQRRNHVQRWDYRPTTKDWVRSSWRIGALGGGSDCVDDNTFNSPYDVGLDGAGNIYVLDVTCRRIQKYTALTGAFQATIWQNYPVGNGEHLYHGLSTSYLGHVDVAGHVRHYRLGVQQTACVPDSDPPRITRLAAPNPNYGRTLVLRLSASDRCSKVLSMRISGPEVTGSSAWRRISPSPTTTLGGADGVKLIDVSVRDSYGRVTSRRIGVRLDTSQPPLHARRRVRIAGDTRYCQPDPLSRIASPQRFVLTDACATLTGRVVRIQRSKQARSVQLRLSLAASRKLYTNAKQPVTIWILGGRRTPTGKALRVGHRASVTTALLADRALTTATGAPVFRWSGL